MTNFASVPASKSVERLLFIPFAVVGVEHVDLVIGQILDGLEVVGKDLEDRFKVSVAENLDVFRP